MEPDEIDPLRQALTEATLSVLLGATSVAQQYVDQQGNVTFGTIELPSVFAGRLAQMAYKGDFDALVTQAMEQVSAAAVARLIEEKIAKQIIDGLGSTRSTFGDRSAPNWLQDRAKAIAVEACTVALAADEALLDTLRARIGAEVDRNRVGITVNLSDPETKS